MNASHYGWDAHLKPMRLSYHDCWTKDQSQLHINILEIMAIRIALKKALQYINHSCVTVSTDNMKKVSYISKQGGTHSSNLCVEVWEILHWNLEHNINLRICHIQGKFNNVDLFATRVNHKHPLYVSQVPDNQAFAIDALSMNWNNLHAYAFLPTVWIPPILTKFCPSGCRIVLIALLWPQRPWLSEVLRLVDSAPIRLPFSKLTNMSLKTSQLLSSRLGVIKQSIRDKIFCKTLQISSQNGEDNLLRKSMMQNGSYIPLGVKGRRLISWPLLLS